MAVHVLKPGQSVTIKVVDVHECSAGMRMLESTYLVYGVLAEIERIWSTGGRGGTGSTALRASPRCSAGIAYPSDAP